MQRDGLFFEGVAESIRMDGKGRPEHAVGRGAGSADPPGGRTNGCFFVDTAADLFDGGADGADGACHHGGLDRQQHGVFSADPDRRNAGFL